MDRPSKLFATFGHVHNGYKKAASQKRERVEVSISYGFPIPSTKVCLLWEAVATAQPATLHEGLKLSNCEERPIFTWSELGLFK